MELLKKRSMGLFIALTKIIKRCTMTTLLSIIQPQKGCHMATLHHRMFGMVHGDFRPAHHSPENLETMVQGSISSLGRQMPVYLPKADFTTEVANFEEDRQSLSDMFVRTQCAADGGVVEERNIAVGIFNGDCPIVCIYEDDRLAALHAGYRCLMRANPAEPDIITRFMQSRKMSPHRAQAFVFGGIGPCCWKPEYKDKPEILDPARYGYPPLLKACLRNTKSKGPFGSGFVSVDLYEMAFRLLLQSEIPRKRIAMDKTCTCCATKNSELQYWSHTRFEARSQEVDGRNLSIAWLE